MSNHDHENHHHHHVHVHDDDSSTPPQNLENHHGYSFPNHILEDSFSRLSITFQNPITSMNLGGESSSMNLTDESFLGTPSIPNHHPYSDVQLMEQPQNNLYDEGLLEQLRISIIDGNGIGINRLRSNHVASGLHGNNPWLLPFVNDRFHSVFGENSNIGVVGYGDNDRASICRRNRNYMRQRRTFLRNNRNQQSLHKPLSVQELRGRILEMAKEESGCKVVQETMDSLSTEEEVSIVFEELIDNVTQLMSHPHGNFVFEKLLKICSEEQMTRIVVNVTSNNGFELLFNCLHNHGTRSVQNLLNYVSNRQQRFLIMSVLNPNTTLLAKDRNGGYVIQKCLQVFSTQDTECMMGRMAYFCHDIAIDKSGCCTIKFCLDHASGFLKETLMNQIICYAHPLSENNYGNYVVQHLLSLRIPRITSRLLKQLKGNFLSLSCNKFGSNVVEKFLAETDEVDFSRIVLELIHDPNFLQLLVDPFGNYVFSSAVKRSQGHLQLSLVKIVYENYPLMRKDAYGKKIIACLKQALPHLVRYFKDRS